MSNRRILMVGDHIPYVRYAKDLDFDIVLFQSPDRMNLTDSNLCESIHIFDFKEVNLAIEIAKAIHSSHPLDAVWTFTEQGIELTSFVAEELGFPHIPKKSVQLAQNKSKFRKCLNDFGVSSVAFIQTSHLESIKQFAVSTGYPIVLKPVDGAGSRDVFIISSEKELEKVVRERELPLSSFIVEEFLDGPEVSVEFITFNGIHYPLVITDKMATPKHCVEIGHTIPSIYSADQMLQQEIYDLVKQMLDLIGHSLGPSHTEIKLTSKGPKIVEVNIRPGGDFIPYMIEKAMGYNLFGETLKYLIGDTYALPELTEGAAAVRYFQFPTGIIDEIHGTGQIKEDPNLLWLEFNLKEGDMIPEMVHSYTRSGCIVVKGDTAELASLYANRLIKKIQVKVRSLDERK